MPSLLNLSEEAERLSKIIEEYADEHEGDLTDIDPQIDFWFNSNQNSLSDKVDSIVGVIREIEARSDARENEATRLRLLAKRDEAKRERLLEYVKLCMTKMGASKLSGLRHEVRVVRNGGALPLKFAGTVTASTIGERFTKTVVTIDSSRVREALEAGETIPGVEFGERGTSVRWK